MNDSRRRDFLKVAGGVAVVGSLAGCAGEAQEDGNGGGGQNGNQTDGQQQDQPQEDQPQDEQPEEEQPQDGQQEATGDDLIRIAHMVPDFPAVDIYVDDSEEPVFSGIEYTDVTGYVDLAAGDHQVRITTAGSQGLVIFDQQVTIPAGNTTAVALPTPDEAMADGQQGGGQQGGGGMDLGFQLQLFGDQNTPPEEAISNARIRLIHAAPDAPAVDVLVGQTTVFDNVSFGEAAYFDLPAGDYEFDVVPADSGAGGNGGGGTGGGGGNESNGGGLFSQLGATSGGGGISLLQEDGNQTEEGQPPEEGEEEGEPETEPVLTFDASPATNSVYTVFVTGYIEPEAANSEAELTTVTVQDVDEGEVIQAEDE